MKVEPEGFWYSQEVLLVYIRPRKGRTREGGYKVRYISSRVDESSFGKAWNLMDEVCWGSREALKMNPLSHEGYGGSAIAECVAPTARRSLVLTTFW